MNCFVIKNSKTNRYVPSLGTKCRAVYTPSLGLARTFDTRGEASSITMPWEVVCDVADILRRSEGT